MKKHVCVRIIVLIVLLVLACVPMHVYMSDGGSQGWYAILWQYTKYHEMLGVDEGWRVGPQVTLLGSIPIYDGTQIVADEEETFSELSKLYHVSEINQAIAVIKKEFEPYWAKDDRWSGCTLREIEYAGDEVTEKEMKYYLSEREQGHFETWGDFNQVIILTSTLDVDETGGDGSFEPNRSYTDWKWILVRSEGGPWRHVDHGYDVYAEWSLDTTEFEKEVERANNVMEAHSSESYDLLTIQKGPWTCLFYSYKGYAPYTSRGDGPFGPIHSSYDYTVFAYDPIRLRVRYLNGYSLEDGAYEPYYLKIDWE